MGFILPNAYLMLAMIMKLTFFPDKSGRKLISRLPNGKVVMQHKHDTHTIIPGLEYIVEVDREFDNMAFCKVISLAYYPRFILKNDGSVVVVVMRGNKDIRILSPSLAHAIRNYLPYDTWALVLRRR